MKRKLQIFISSTHDDLVEERQKIMQTILKAGHIPAGMELFRGSSEIKKIIYQWIDESDVYVIMIGGRYGSIDGVSGKSFTELEFNYACEIGKPIIRIIFNEDYLKRKQERYKEEEKEIELFEKENISEYNVFVNQVKRKNQVVFPTNIDDLSSEFMIELANIINTYKQKLKGWTKIDDIIEDEIVDLVPTKNLLKFSKKYLEKFFENQKEYKRISLEGIADNIFDNLKYDTILEESIRTITLDFEDEEKTGLIKVTTQKHEKYLYAQKKGHSYQMDFVATQQQAETYSVEKLLIDGVDYTSSIVIEKERKKNRGQFEWHVRSKSIPIPKNCCIELTASYYCPAAAFYQSHKLSYPCQNFALHVINRNDNKRYSLLASTFSTFSKSQYDDVATREVDNTSTSVGTCLLRLPAWSMPGTGYVITLKEKTEDNHV